MGRKQIKRRLRSIGHALLVSIGAVVLSLTFFLVLPFMQVISQPTQDEMTATRVETVDLPPPPPPPEEEEPEEPEKLEEDLTLEEPAPLLDLAQLELALNPTLGSGMATGDFAIKLGAGGQGQGDGTDALFAEADLDQRPRVIYQPGPSLSSTLRARAPGTVHVIFVVNQDGRVEDPIVQKSTDPVFERPALAAIKQWKFEPGKRKGEPVRFRMRVPIVFPKGT